MLARDIVQEMKNGLPQIRIQEIVRLQEEILLWTQAQVVNLSYAGMLRGLYLNMDSRSQYYLDDVGRELPFLGPWLKAQDNIDFAEDYLRNTGRDWSDIKYHKLNLGLGSATSGALNFVSSNVMNLYKKGKK